MRPKGYKDRPIETLLMVGVLILLLVIAKAGCIGSTAKIEQTGEGNSSTTDASQNVARIDKLAADIDVTLKAIEALQIEMRAGTQEKKDSTDAGRDASAVNTQQAGFFNVSLGEAVAGGSAVAGVIGVGLWLYALRKQGEREVLREREADREETNRAWLHGNMSLRMAGRDPLPMEYRPLSSDELCIRSWRPFAKCGRSVT